MSITERAANALDGLRLEGPEEAGELVCDFCSKHIEDGEAITVYATNIDYTRKPPRGSVYPCRVYCSECDQATLKLPLKQAEEFIIGGDMVREGVPTFENTITIDHSPRGEGVDWEPTRVFAEFTGQNLTEMMRHDQATNFGPEDVIDHLRLGDLDVREHINEDGKITMPKSERVEIRDEVHRKMVEAVTS